MTERRSYAGRVAIVAAPPETVRIGQAVQVVYDPLTPEVTLPRWRRVASA